MKNLNLILIGWLVLFSTAQAQIYVDLSAAGNNDGSSWADAFTSIQAAVDLSMVDAEIYIAEGTYFEGAEILVSQSLSLIGGFPAGGGAQIIENHPTVIDGANAHRVLRSTHTSGTLFLEGLTIQGGKLTESTTASGGGINTSGDLDLNQVVVSNNSISTLSSSPDSFSFGGGIYTLSGSITLTNSQISNNNVSSTSLSSFSVSKGGGIFTSSGNITLTNSKVTNNNLSSSTSSDSSNKFSESLGGGIYTSSGSVTFTNSQITNNSSSSASTSTFEESASSTSAGGGVYTDFGNANLTNSQVANNNVSSTSASVSKPDIIPPTNAIGGGIYTNNGSITLTNSLVSNNTSSAFSPTLDVTVIGGVSGTTILQNSILWGNTKTTDEGFTFVPSEHEGGTFTANHSLVKNQNPAGTGNIDATVMDFDPLFVNEAAGNFRLLAGSPLIDAGDFNLLPLDDYDIDGDGDLLERIPLDLDGYAREIGLNVDIGPYEFGDLIFRDGFE